MERLPGEQHTASTGFDWNDYWAFNKLPQSAVIAQRRWVRRIIKLSRITGTEFQSIADFGCGPAIMLFELARRLPRSSFYGFDLSDMIVEKNLERARSLGLSNISFRRVRLPQVPRQLKFDLILSIATLHYVSNNLLAIRNLYAALNPGGFLIFNYPNLYTMHWYRKNSDENMRRRFALVIAGKNILSKETIDRTVGRPSHNFWSVVGEKVVKGNPCIFVRSPFNASVGFESHSSQVV